MKHSSQKVANGRALCVANDIAFQGRLCIRGILKKGETWISKELRLRRI